MTLVISKQVSSFHISPCLLVDNAKVFKEEFLKRNVKIQSGLLNLQSMRLGIGSVIALSTGIGEKDVSHPFIHDLIYGCFIRLND